jgi:hypothetical protein
MESETDRGARGSLWATSGFDLPSAEGISASAEGVEVRDVKRSRTLEADLDVGSHDRVRSVKVLLLPRRGRLPGLAGRGLVVVSSTGFSAGPRAAEMAGLSSAWN